VKRSLPIVLVLLVVVALGFVLLSPRSSQVTSSTSPSSPTPVSPTPTNPANSSVSPPTPTNLEVSSRVIEGGIDLPLEGDTLRVAVLVGTQRVADAPAPGGKFRIALPEKLENVPLSALSDIPLPHGDGRLQSSDGALAAMAHVFAYQDANGNKRLDEGEPSAEGELSKTDVAPDLRGFFKNELVLTSKATSLNEDQDSRTGAKGYYRYQLSLAPGWHVLEGEFGSNGYDVREATGSGWNLVVPFKPAAPGPKTPQQ
jgi:hypothetical protein